MVGAQPGSQASFAPSTRKAILVGGLLVAVLHLTEVIVVYGLAVGMRPFRVPQAVASAVSAGLLEAGPALQSALSASL